MLRVTTTAACASRPPASASRCATRRPNVYDGETRVGQAALFRRMGVSFCSLSFSPPCIAPTFVSEVWLVLSQGNLSMHDVVGCALPRLCDRLFSSCVASSLEITRGRSVSFLARKSSGSGDHRAWRSRPCRAPLRKSPGF